MAGFHAGGIAAVAKHFPGHGDTGVDSHYGLPEVTHTLEQIQQIDLPPFRADIAAGVDTIMTAHVVMPAIDPRRAGDDVAQDPHRTAARRARVRRTDRHRRPGHGRATATYPPNVAPVKALLAGADQLLVAPQMDTAYGSVLAAARSGELSAKRIDESVYRVLLHKFQRGLFRDVHVDPAAAPQVLGAPQHLADAQAITDRTTTLVKNDGGRLPLTPGPRKRARRGLGRGHDPGDGGRAGRTWSHDAGPRVRAPHPRRRPSTSPSVRADADLVVVSTNNAYAVDATTKLPTPAAAAQTRLVRALLATGKPVVVAAMRNPYDVASFPEAPTVVDTFGYTTAPGGVAGAGALRRGEAGWPAAGVDPAYGWHRRAVPVRPRPDLLNAVLLW